MLAHDGAGVAAALPGVGVARGGRRAQVPFVAVSVSPDLAVPDDGRRSRDRRAAGTDRARAECSHGDDGSCEARCNRADMETLPSSVGPPGLRGNAAQHTVAPEMRAEGSRTRQVSVRVFFTPRIRDLRVNHGSATSAKLTGDGHAPPGRRSSPAAPPGPRARGARAALAGRQRPQLAVGDVRRQPRRHRAARLRRHAPAEATGPDCPRPLLGIGLCGALTTFSTLQLEALELADNGHALLGATYALTSIAAGLLVAYA